MQEENKRRRRETARGMGERQGYGGTVLKDCMVVLVESCGIDSGPLTC